MRIQSVNNQPNFQALKMTNVKKQLTNGIRDINIYSIDSRDKDFIERMYNIAKSQSFPDDKKILGAETVRAVYDRALKTAKNLSRWAYDRVFLAVENGNKITGIMEIAGKGDQRVKGLAVWNDDSLTRKALMLTAMKDTEKLSDFALILPTKNASESVKRFFRTLKFNVPKGEREMMIECENMTSALRAVEDSADAKITHHHSTRNVDLSELLKLDE